jgi:hypothetical protein
MTARSNSNGKVRSSNVQQYGESSPEDTDFATKASPLGRLCLLREHNTQIHSVGKQGSEWYT